MYGAPIQIDRRGHYWPSREQIVCMVVASVIGLLCGLPAGAAYTLAQHQTRLAVIEAQLRINTMQLELCEKRWEQVLTEMRLLPAKTAERLQK